MKPFSQVAILAIAIRVVLIVYGEWQDRHLEVKYTDVDYWVFSDAAHALAAGRSPFTRSTYRYTPLLAVLLLPNVFLTSVWGKILFSASDILTGRLVYLFLLRVTNSVRAAKLSAIFILLNPMTFTISTRGNAESILSSIILASLYFCTSGRYMLGGLLYGVAVHLKLFPIIYGVAIFCYLWSGKLRRSIDVPPLSPRKELSPSPSPSPVSSNESSPNRIKNRRKTKNRDQNSPRLSAMSSPKKITSVSVTTRKMRIWSIFIFGLFSALSFGLLTFLSYWKYGGDYLNEAIIYHLSRKDHRHNFSPYFYLFYTESFLSLPKYSELAAFVPQVLFFVLAGVKFGKKDLPFSLFIITFVFVTFNKVITSQVPGKCCSPS